MSFIWGGMCERHPKLRGLPGPAGLIVPRVDRMDRHLTTRVQRSGPEDAAEELFQRTSDLLKLVEGRSVTRRLSARARSYRDDHPHATAFPARQRC